MGLKPAEPKFFATPDAFGRWLAKHHGSATELLVGFHKRATGKPSMTWAESVEQAVAFGWIDGVRRRIDGDAYTIRFTPRKSGSIWSKVNVATARRLIEEGRMAPAGRAAFERRTEARTGVYSAEQSSVELGPEFERRLRANRGAWRFFEAQSKTYRKAAKWWVVSAKREETRRRRLETLIEYSAAGLWVKPMRPAQPKGRTTRGRAPAKPRSAR